MNIPQEKPGATTDSEGHARYLQILVCGSPQCGKTTLAKKLAGGGRVLLDVPSPHTPGGIATAAATADLALIVVDAREGLRTQTRHEAHIAAMLGIRHLVLVVNKLDTVGFNREPFDAIEAAFRTFAAELEVLDIQAIPLSALQGDNLQQRSAHMPWYTGPTLLQYLERIDTAGSNAASPLRLPLLSVTQDETGLRRFSGVVAAGSVRPGAALRVLPAGVQSRIKEVFVDGTAVDSANMGAAVTVTLTDAVAASRGDVLVAAEAPPEVADQFEARLLWISPHAMTPGRQYLLKLATSEVTATITGIKYREDIDTGAQLASKTLGRYEIATVNLSTNTPLVFEPCRVNRTLGSFVLLDKLSGEIVGAGSIDFALRRASNIHWQALELHKVARAEQKQQTPRCIWFTGLSGSGKSTLANLLEKRLYAEGRHSYLLDGDNVRHGLNRDLGFTEADRVENIRRVAEVAKLMVDAGLIVLVSFISPFRSERRMARELFAAGEFIEVYVDTPIEVCEQRDVKGLYAKARRGELKNFTGIDSPYEAPLAPEARVDTSAGSLEDCVVRVLEFLEPGK